MEKQISIPPAKLTDPDRGLNTTTGRLAQSWFTQNV
jgi:hypothetical protein